MSGNQGNSNNPNQAPGKGVFSPSHGLMFGAISLFVGGVTYLVLKQHWIGTIMAHLGALGLVVVLGVVIALIARRKGFTFGRAFSYGAGLPLMIGLLAVLFFYLRQGVVYCGGSVVLGVILLLIIFTAILPRKLTAKQ